MSLIEQVFSPLIVRAAHQAHDVAAGVEIEGAGLAHESHIRFVRQLIALAAIARMAAGHKVFPRRGSST